jgi:hypothetical protein
MIPERLKKILELLKGKTLDKKAIWNKTSGGNQFKLSINDGSAITISEWENNWASPQFEIVIFNTSGDAIERFNTEIDGITKEDTSLLQSFHKAASDSYYKVDETLDALLESIMHQDIIGNKEEPTSPTVPDEDDLPF